MAPDRTEKVPARVRTFRFILLIVMGLVSLAALIAPLALSPDVRPMASSPALDAMYVKTPPEDGFFDTNVYYLGGVAPHYNWTLEPWTTWSQD